MGLISLWIIAIYGYACPANGLSCASGPQSYTAMREWLDNNGSAMQHGHTHPYSYEGTTTLFETPYFDEVLHI